MKAFELKPSWRLGFPLFLLFAYICATPFRDIYGLEARNALMAKEMLTGGITLIPQATGLPYPDYPPLYFWAELLFSLPFGRVTTFSAILPSAISAVAIVVLTFFLAKKVNPRIGLLSALILSTFPDFWNMAGSATIDMLLALNVTAAILCLFFSDTAIKAHSKRLLEVGAAVFIVLSFLTKGPIGIVLPGAVWGGYLLFEQRVKDFYFFVAFMAATGLICFGGELYVVWKMGGTTLFKEVVNMQVTGRVGQEANQPMYYYVVCLLTTAGTWLLWCIPAFCGLHIKPQDNGGLKRLWQEALSSPVLRLCLVWVVAIFLIFTLASTKKSRYLLPLFPGLAILLSVGVNRILENGNLVRPRVWEFFLSGLTAILVIAGWGGIFFFPEYAFPPLLSIFLWSIVIFAGWASIQIFVSREFRLVWLTALILATGLSGASLLIEVPYSKLESGKAFIEKSDRQVPPEIPVAIFGIVRDSYGINCAFFSHRKPKDFLFLTDPEALKSIPDPCIVIGYKEDDGIITSTLGGEKLRCLSQGLIHRRPVVSYLFH